MIAQPSRTLTIGATTPVNIRKTPAFANDPAAYPVTFSLLRYPSGGGTIQLYETDGFAKGQLTFQFQPTATETIAVNGVTFTFIAGASTATDVHIGDTLLDTVANFVAVLNASANGSISVATYSQNGNVLNIVYDTVGTGGNAFTLANSSGTVAVTRSGSVLAGGYAYGTGVSVDAGVDYNSPDQSLALYALSSTGSISLTVTDYQA